MVFAETVPQKSVVFPNTTGADLKQGDFAVVGPFAGIADGDIAEDAVGSFHVEEGIRVNTADLVYGQDTFATLGQPVFWDATSLEFSDTETAGYYLVGYLLEVKDANGAITFEKRRYAVEISS